MLAVAPRALPRGCCSALAKVTCVMNLQIRRLLSKPLTMPVRSVFQQAQERVKNKISNPDGLLQRVISSRPAQATSGDQLRAKILGYREDCFSIGGIDFEVDLTDPMRKSTSERLMALKYWDHVDVYLDSISKIQCDRMLEFGIHQGAAP